jgi:NADH:ubiquinone oxidoreductase subunit K
MSGHLTSYLLVGAALFSVGLYGALTRRNAIAVLMCIELMLNAANLNLVAFNRFLGPGGATMQHGVVPSGYVGPLLGGQVFSIIVITIAAAEAAIGLAIIITVYKNARTINLDDISFMKW